MRVPLIPAVARTFTTTTAGTSSGKKNRSSSARSSGGSCTAFPQTPGSDNRHRQASLSYLCGQDDAGRWAARVPGSITTVHDALVWITPAEIHQARQRGRRVLRQGDIYAIETTRAHDTPSGWIGEDRRYDPKTGEWVTSHYWNAATRRLVHRPEDGRKHRPLQAHFPVRFVQQNVYGMGRGAGRRLGD